MNVPQGDKAYRSWDKFLDPDRLKSNLIHASIFLTCYELLRSSVVDQLRGFYTNGFDGDREIISEEYKTKVLALNKNPFVASCLWFVRMQAITEEEMAVMRAITDHRNEIAHELPRFIGTVDAQVDLQLLDSIQFIISKVDRWWIREIEMPTNPDFDAEKMEQIAWNDVRSGNMILMELILRVISGKEEELRSIQLALREACQHRRSRP